MQIKKLVNDKPLWDSFCETLDAKIAQTHKKMEQVTTTDEMFRCQGEIAGLRKLKYLRDEVNGNS